MKFIYFLRTRTAIVFLIIMAIICTAALFVAGGMTVVAYKKQAQEIGSPHVVNSSNAEHPKVILPNLKNLQEIPLYFNGTRQNGLIAFSTTKSEILLPIDDIFNLVKIEYTYHTADGLIEAHYKGDDIVLKVWSDVFTINGDEKRLPYGVVLANDRIMVPIEFLNNIKDFSASGKAYLSVAYVNFHPKYNSEDYKNIYYLAEKSESESIFSLNGLNKYAFKNIEENYYVQYSNERKSVLYIDNGKATIIDAKNSPLTLPLGEMAEWSEDKKTVYEPLDDFESFEIYDFNQKKVRVFEDLRETITSNDEFIDFNKGMLSLKSYWSDGFTTKLEVKNNRTDNVCTIVYRGKKTVLVAKAYTSPTGKYLVYVKGGDYRLLDLNGGRDIILEENAIAVNWVTDNIIQILKDEKWLVYNTSGKLVNYDEKLKYLGVVDDSTVLYKDSKAIYKSVDGIVEKVVDASFDVDNVVSAPDLFSIIAGDKERNALYLISGSVYTFVGQYNSMLKTYSSNGYKEDITKSVKLSPDGKTFCIAQLGKETVSVKIVASDGSWVKDIWLDSNAYMRFMYDNTNLQFINNNKIIFNDQNFIWLIDIENKDVQVTRLPNTYDNSYIKGIMLKN